MIAGARHLPVHHLSIRVPWHDAGWTGVVCNKPASNIACRTLPRIADEKDDSAETAVAGKSLADLSPDQFPACKFERSSFMAPFPITVIREHPYAGDNSESHAHFRPTRYTMQPYSAACVPFRWMHREEGAELVERYNLGFQPEREPDLGFDPSWIQDRVNQLVMLDTFFGAVHPGQSLCFFYAKDTPLSASAGRVIVGVGLVRDVGPHVEYEYSTANPPLRSAVWERNVEHSIRPGFEEGFLFPYQELSDLAIEKGLDPEQFLAFAPEGAFGSFSYASEHVSHDPAIAAVLNCMRALDRIETVLPGPWKRAMSWLDGQLNRLWRLRGPFPGFGSALSAFIGDGGNLVAYELAEQCAEASHEGTIDPWPAFEQLMRAPHAATGSARELIGEGFARAWRAMRPERQELLKLLSRFSIEASQAVRAFDPDQRPADVGDADLISNPYLLYELHRLTDDPISVMTIDRGMLPDRVILEAHPLPERSRLEDKIDPRRVRALLVAALEHGAEQGHTLLPRSWLKASIDKMPLETDCPVGPEVIAGLGESLVGVVDSIEMADGSPAYQLQRFTETARLIRGMVKRRLGPRSRRHKSTHDFRAVVDRSLG
ncbi:MAG: RNA helicase, partial [Gemmatimonadetes bacterium]|nr:RNA helicase [Gemmatimonadota bacterium]